MENSGLFGALNKLVVIYISIKHFYETFIDLKLLLLFDEVHVIELDLIHIDTWNRLYDI